MGRQRSLRPRTAGAVRRDTTAPAGVAPAPGRARGHPLLDLQRRFGNRSLTEVLWSGTLAPGRAVSEPHSAAEQQAERIAEELLAHPADGALLSPLGAGGGPRIHTDADAARLNRSFAARAFTVGRDIYFGAGQYRPGSHDGQQLLAHELAHVVQQQRAGALPLGHGLGATFLRSPVAIHRQATGATAAPPITARAMLPFPVGSRVLVTRTMEDLWLSVLTERRPDLAAALRGMAGKIATVTVASDDLVEATFADPITIPAQGDEPARTLNQATLSMRRTESGDFNLELSGIPAGQTERTAVFTQADMTASAAGETTVLSSGAGPSAVPQLSVTRGAGGTVSLQAHTAPYLAEVPTVLRRAVPPTLDVMSFTRLPDVRPGTAEERAAVEQITSRVTREQDERRQRLMVGGGLQFGAQLDPLFAASWQLNFRPVQPGGSMLRIGASLVRVPIEVQIQYAPPASVVGALSSGAEVSLSQFRIPVNVRVIAGLGGGVLQGATPEGGGERPSLPAFGPVVGGRAGLELGAFRLDLSYEHLFNLVRNSPDTNVLLLRLGGAF